MNFLSICDFSITPIWPIITLISSIFCYGLALILVYIIVEFIKKLFLKYKKEELPDKFLLLSTIVTMILMICFIPLLLEVVADFMTEKFFRLRENIDFNAFYQEYSDYYRPSLTYIKLWLSGIPIFSFGYSKLINKLNNSLKFILQILLIFIIVFLVFVFIGSYNTVIENLYSFDCYW